MTLQNTNDHLCDFNGYFQLLSIFQNFNRHTNGICEYYNSDDPKLNQTFVSVSICICIFKVQEPIAVINALDGERLD